jgi:hypothetical protein
MVSPAAAIAIQANAAPAVAAVAPVSVDTRTPVAAVSITDTPVAPIKADTAVTAVTSVQPDTAVAAVKADTPITAISAEPAISDVFDERGAVLLDALAEGGGRNGLAAGRGTSD